MQDRANVSADFLELMKQEIIEVIKKYIDVDESAIDVRLTNKENDDGTNGAPALYANIPILNIKNEARKVEKKNRKERTKKRKKKKKKRKRSRTNKKRRRRKKRRNEKKKIEQAEIIIEEAKKRRKQKENRQKKKIRRK